MPLILLILRPATRLDSFLGVDRGPPTYGVTPSVNRDEVCFFLCSVDRFISSSSLIVWLELPVGQKWQKNPSLVPDLSGTFSVFSYPVGW